MASRGTKFVKTASDGRGGKKKTQGVSMRSPKKVNTEKKSSAKRRAAAAENKGKGAPSKVPASGDL